MNVPNLVAEGVPIRRGIAVGGGLESISLVQNEHANLYRAKDPAMLKGLKAGDRVRFEPAEVNGAYTVTRIEKAK